MVHHSPAKSSCVLQHTAMASFPLFHTLSFSPGCHWPPERLNLQRLSSNRLSSGGLSGRRLPSVGLDSKRLWLLERWCLKSTKLQVSRPERRVWLLPRLANLNWECWGEGRSVLSGVLCATVSIVHISKHPKRPLTVGATAEFIGFLNHSAAKAIQQT